MCAHMCTYACCTCTHMCVHVCTHVCSYQTRVCVPAELMFVFRRTLVCVCSGCTYTFIYIYMCAFTCTHMCSRVRTCAFQLDTCLCSRMLQDNTCLLSDKHVCVFVSAPRADVCVFICAHACFTCTYLFVHVYTHVYPNWTRVCVSGEYMIVFRCTHVFVCVPRVQRRVFTCTHFCVPIRHVFVFQENTCLSSDEHSCVCLCFPRAHRCVCVCSRVQYTCVGVCSTCAHMCVHACTFMSPTCTHMCVPVGHVFVSQVNRCVFHVNTLACARWFFGI